MVTPAPMPMVQSDRLDLIIILHFSCDYVLLHFICSPFYVMDVMAAACSLTD